MTIQSYATKIASNIKNESIQQENGHLLHQDTWDLNKFSAVFHQGACFPMS